MTQVCVLERVVWSRRGLTSFNASVGNQVQSSGVVYVSLPATVFGLVHEVQLAICPCPRIYYTSAAIQNNTRRVELSHASGSCSCWCIPRSGAISQPSFKVAPKMKRLRHQIQPVPPHPEGDTSLSKLLSS